MSLKAPAIKKKGPKIHPVTGTGLALQTVLHNPDKLSEWPTFGLGLDLTNWISRAFKTR